MADSKDIAMAGFSGYMAFTGTLAEQARVIMRNGEKLPYIGKIFAVTDGVITGCFDKNGNPDKAYLDVVGTAITAYGFSVAGGLAGDTRVQKGVQVCKKC